MPRAMLVLVVLGMTSIDRLEAQEAADRLALQRAIDHLRSHLEASGACDGRWGDRDADLAATGAVVLAFGAALDAADRPEVTAEWRSIRGASLRWIVDEVSRLEAGGWPAGRRSHLNFQLPILLEALVDAARRGAVDARPAAARVAGRLATTIGAAGGWTYGEPDPYPLLATTAAAVAALAHARDLGIPGLAPSIHAGLLYLRGCSREDGGLAYAEGLDHPILAADADRYGRSKPGATLLALDAFATAEPRDPDLIAPAEAYLRRFPLPCLDVDADNWWYWAFWTWRCRSDLPADIRANIESELAPRLHRLQQPGGRVPWKGKSWTSLLFPESVVDTLATALAVEVLAADRTRERALDEEIRSAIERGTRFAVRARAAGEGTSSPAREWSQAVHADSILGLALLDSGAVPGRDAAGLLLDELAIAVRRQIPWRGKLRATPDSGRDDAAYETWLASFASLFLTRLRELDPEAVPFGVLESLALRLVTLQKPGGGWSHDLGPKTRTSSFGTLQYADDLVIASAFALGALASLREAGIAIEAAVFVRARSYFEKTRNADGGWKYGLGHVWPDADLSERGRSAAVLWALPRAFGADAFELEPTVAYIRDGIAQVALSPGHGNRPFLISYIAAALATRAHPSALGRPLRLTVVRAILDAQRADGSFDLYQSLWEGPIENTAVALTLLSSALP